MCLVLVFTSRISKSWLTRTEGGRHEQELVAERVVGAVVGRLEHEIDSVREDRPLRPCDKNRPGHEQRCRFIETLES